MDEQEKVQTKAQLLTLDEAANFLELKKSYIYKLVHLKQIPHYKYGARFLRFRYEDLEAWKASKLREIPTAAQLQSQAANYCMNHPR